MPAALLARFGRATAEQVVTPHRGAGGGASSGGAGAAGGRELPPGSERDFALGCLSQFAQPMGDGRGGWRSDRQRRAGAGSMAMGSHAAHLAQREYRPEDEPAEDVPDLEVSAALVDAMLKLWPEPEGSGFVRPARWSTRWSRTRSATMLRGAGACRSVARLPRCGQFSCGTGAPRCRDAAGRFARDGGRARGGRGVAGSGRRGGRTQASAASAEICVQPVSSERRQSGGPPHRDRSTGKPWPRLGQRQHRQH